MSWTAPASNGGAAISGYRIEVSTDGGTNFSQLVVSQSKTTYSHTGLSAGLARHYRVRASNSVGNSGWSNTANATTGAATAPTAPRSLTATSVGQTTINLSWTAPASNGGTAISGYRIEWSANGTSNWQNVSPAHTGTERIYADTGLNSGTTRHYRVYASNSVGESTAASNVDNATTISASASATAPSAPRSMTATASGQTTINLSWSAPSSTGGASITGYRIQWSTDGNDPWTNLTRTNPTATATTDSHTGLTAGTTRYYRVYAINSVGESPASSATAATTGTATAPTAPRFLRATASGQTTINLSWSAPSSTGDASIIGYRIEVSDDGSTNWEDLVENHIETTYSHTGLTESTTRHYRVYAINSVGESSASDVVNATTATGTSTGIVVSFDVASSQVNETTATATVQVNVNPAPTTSLTMTYSLGGTATENADYTFKDQALS